MIIIFFLLVIFSPPDRALRNEKTVLATHESMTNLRLGSNNIWKVHAVRVFFIFLLQWTRPAERTGKKWNSKNKRGAGWAIEKSCWDANFRHSFPSFLAPSSCQPIISPFIQSHISLSLSLSLSSLSLSLESRYAADAILPRLLLYFICSRGEVIFDSLVKNVFCSLFFKQIFFFFFLRFSSVLQIFKNTFLSCVQIL